VVLTAARLRVIGEKLLADRDDPPYLLGERAKDLVCIFGVPIFSAVLDLFTIISRVNSLYVHENTSSIILCGSSAGALIVFNFLEQFPSSSLFFDMKILLKISCGPGDLASSASVSTFF
jgi:hypothetical protein